MRRLTVTGFTDDGTELLLTAEPARSGPEAREGVYVLSLDDHLWAALRQDRARLSQLQLADPAAVRPRDIQARVRAGQSPEEVADAAGVPVARVLAFALPVVAEREHIARTAQATPLRHRTGAPVTLSDAVQAAVRAAAARDGSSPEGAAGGDLVWDAYRRPTGTWIVRVDGFGPAAHFAFDPAARSVVPDDDAARELVAEPEPPVIGVSYETRTTRPDPVAEPTPVPAARVAAARADSTPWDSPRDLSPRDPSRESTARDGGRGRRALRYLAFRDEDGAPTPGAPPSGSAESGSAESGSAGPGSAGPDVDTPELGALFEAAPEAEHATSAAAEGAPPSRSGRRPAVPSWDEIVFGRKDE